MYQQIASLADAIVLTTPLSERALDPQTLAQLPASANKSAEVIPDIQTAWERGIQQANKNDLVCGAGSIYFVGEILKFCESYKPANRYP